MKWSFLACLLLVILHHHHHLQPSMAAKCHPDDESALLGFKSNIKQDPSGMLTSWKPGTDCCTWSSIDCNTNRVTSLNLVGQPSNTTTTLSGTISPSLSKLKYLNNLFLQNLLFLTGPFPTFLSSLPNLGAIYIENNRLSGPLPIDINTRLPSKLFALGLSGNHFSGSIPTSISHLLQLIQLKLNRNQFSGPLPPALSNLNKLTYLDLSHNKLSGKIPDFFTAFTDLRDLRLSGNKFTGEIPATISSLASKLSSLQLARNLLTGKIPGFLGNFVALDTLDLSSNYLTGVVPQSFKNLTKIFNLNLASNRLTNPFPEMNVKGIESLDLSYNMFNLGQIPKWVATSPIIYSLKLARCGIKMRLDDWKPTQTFFYDYIDLSENQISGSPVALLSRTDLQLVEFAISGNQLKFDLSGIVLPKSLKKLDLSRNQIFGKVAVNVVKVENVNVSYNHLCGQIPVTKAPASAFLGNDCLCGSPLPPCKS